MLLLDVVAPAGADADTYAYSLMYGPPASYGTRLCPSSAHTMSAYGISYLVRHSSTSVTETSTVTRSGPRSLRAPSAWTF
jgi:hypothetical protein